MVHTFHQYSLASSLMDVVIANNNVPSWRPCRLWDAIVSDRTCGIEDRESVCAFVCYRRIGEVHKKKYSKDEQ